MIYWPKMSWYLIQVLKFLLVRLQTSKNSRMLLKSTRNTSKSLHYWRTTLPWIQPSISPLFPIVLEGTLPRGSGTLKYFNWRISNASIALTLWWRNCTKKKIWSPQNLPPFESLKQKNSRNSPYELLKNSIRILEKCERAMECSLSFFRTCSRILTHLIVVTSARTTWEILWNCL